MLEAQQRYFSYRAILVAIVSQNSFVLVLMGYRTISIAISRDMGPLRKTQIVSNCAKIVCSQNCRDVKNEVFEKKIILCFCLFYVAARETEKSTSR